MAAAGAAAAAAAEAAAAADEAVADGEEDTEDEAPANEMVTKEEQWQPDHTNNGQNDCKYVDRDSKHSIGNGLATPSAATTTATAAEQQQQQLRQQGQR